MTAAPEPTAGVNLIGFLESSVGLGEVARKLERAYAHAGIPVSTIVYRRPPSGEGWAEEPVSGEAVHDTNVVCLNAEHLQPFAAEAGTRFFAGRRTIGVWFWETDVLRAVDRRGALFVDEVWVASEYVRQAVAAAVPVPAFVVPLPIETPPAPALTRAQLELPDGFLFLYVFDFLSAERKNPVGVVDAFTRAFAPAEGPVLVLKSVHGRDRKPDLFAELDRLVAGRPDVVLRDGRVPTGERDAYVAACDCYVSLHRSEGYGLTIAEAMSYGKPAIATAYSGNLEFMSDENAYLVPYRTVPVPDSWWAHEPGAGWAEPDTEAAAALMRHAWEHPEEAQALGARARDELLERFSLARAAAFLEARRRAGAPAPAAGGARGAILEASTSLGRGGASALEQGGRGPTGLLRRLLARALWPYLDEQRRYQASVVEALNALRLTVDDLGRRLAVLEAGVAARPEHRLSVERPHVADAGQVAEDA
jgi:glycosyltransferase involved in cell wall biosynthesis